MICIQCQREIAEGTRFCYHCGTPTAASYSRPKPPFSQRRLMRSATDRKIAGVCAGFGEYFDIDPTIVRLLWIIAVFFGGTGIFAYLVAWLIMPLAPEPVPAPVVPGQQPPAR
jgi:phage shock protein C